MSPLVKMTSAVCAPDITESNSTQTVVTIFIRLLRCFDALLHPAEREHSKQHPLQGKCSSGGIEPFAQRMGPSAAPSSAHGDRLPSHGDRNVRVSRRTPQLRVNL